MYGKTIFASTAAERLYPCVDGIPHFQREIDISEFLIPQITDTQQVHLIEEDLLAHIEKQLGASDKETCEQIEKILIYPDGRVEIETK